MRLCEELLRGAVDLHVHSSPDIIERLLDHVELARQARDAGFKAMVVKCHQMGTADRVYFVRKFVGERHD